MQPFNSQQFQAGLERLRQRFLAELPQRLQQIEQALDAARATSCPPDTLRDDLHRLAGAAGSLGFADLGHAARRLEQQVQATGVDPASLAELISLAAQHGCAWPKRRPD